MTKQTNHKPGATAAASATAPDAYARITYRIVADLEQGVRPWCKPWWRSLAGQSVRPGARWADPARDRAWRGGTSGSPSRRPGPRCPRPQVGDPGDLLRRQLRRAPEAHAPGPGRNPPQARSLVDEGPLELRHAGEDRQHHLAGRRGRIGPRLFQAAQAGAALLRISAISSRSRVERASRSSRATTTTSPSRTGRACASTRAGRALRPRPSPRRCVCTRPASARLQDVALVRDRTGGCCAPSCSAWRHSRWHRTDLCLTDNGSTAGVSGPG